MGRLLKAKDVHNRGSLLTEFRGGGKCCVGYILMHEGEAFDPDGRIEGITQTEADTHNKLLSKASIDGLDNQCKVGQGGQFYWDPKTRKVSTWVGDLVSDDVTVTLTTVTFRRKEKVMRGRVHHDDAAVFFKRIS